MVTRTRTTIAGEFDNTLPSHTSERRSAQKEKHFDEDIIMSLSDATENRRARQVVEWERAQPLYVQQAI